MKQLKIKLILEWKGKVSCPKALTVMPTNLLHARSCLRKAEKTNNNETEKITKSIVNLVLWLLGANAKAIVIFSIFSKCIFTIFVYAFSHYLLNNEQYQRNTKPDQNLILPSSEAHWNRPLCHISLANVLL